MKLPYELYTQQRIVDHLENSSPTKFMYSFSRASRFPSVDRRGFSDAFYVFPGIGRTGRKVGIGYGTKYDFTKSRVRTEIIGIKRDFDVGTKPRGFSYSFGESRSKFGKVCTPGNKLIDKNIPGPGKYYSNINTLGNMGSPKYTMRPKCGGTNLMNSTMRYPGPGAYEPVVKINPNGKYPISRCTNTKGRNFGIDGVKRFDSYRYNNVPGPNSYKTSALTGSSIFNSKYQSPSFYSLAQKLTMPNRNERYPGPGSYIRFSEFGILDPNYKKRAHLQTEPSKTKEAEDTKNEENYEDFDNKEEEKPKAEEKIQKQETKKDQSNIEQSKIDQSKIQQSKTEQSKIDQSKIQQSKTEQSKIDQSKIQQSKIEQSKNEQSKIEQSKNEQSKIDQSKIEQSKIQQSKIDQSKIQQSKIEETKNEEKVNEEVEQEQEQEKEKEKEDKESDYPLLLRESLQYGNNEKEAELEN